MKMSTDTYTMSLCCRIFEHLFCVGAFVLLLVGRIYSVSWGLLFRFALVKCLEERDVMMQMSREIHFLVLGGSRGSSFGGQ